MNDKFLARLSTDDINFIVPCLLPLSVKREERRLVQSRVGAFFLHVLTTGFRQSINKKKNK